MVLMRKFILLDHPNHLALLLLDLTFEDCFCKCSILALAESMQHYQPSILKPIDFICKLVNSHYSLTRSNKASARRNMVAV